MPCPVTAGCRQSLLAARAAFGLRFGSDIRLCAAAGFALLPAHFARLCKGYCLRHYLCGCIFYFHRRKQRFRIKSISQLLRDVNTKKIGPMRCTDPSGIIYLSRFCRRGMRLPNPSGGLWPARSFRCCCGHYCSRLCYGRRRCLCLCCSRHGCRSRCRRWA